MFMMGTRTDLMHRGLMSGCQGLVPRGEGRGRGSSQSGRDKTRRSHSVMPPSSLWGINKEEKKEALLRFSLPPENPFPLPLPWVPSGLPLCLLCFSLPFSLPPFYRSFFSALFSPLSCVDIGDAFGRGKGGGGKDEEEGRLCSPLSPRSSSSSSPLALPALPLKLTNVCFLAVCEPFFPRAQCTLEIPPGTTTYYTFRQAKDEGESKGGTDVSRRRRKSAGLDIGGSSFLLLLLRPTLSRWE